MFACTMYLPLESFWPNTTWIFGFSCVLDLKVGGGGGVNKTESVQKVDTDWRKKFSSRSYRGSNQQPSDHEARWAPGLPLHVVQVRHTHARTPTLQPQNPWLSHFLTLQSPYLEQSPPKHHAATLSSFKSRLKTFLFSEYFS